MNARPLALLALALACSSFARADELELIGRHALEGRRDGRPVEGWLEVRPDATYAGERRVGDVVEQLSGLVSIDREALVLTPDQGLTRALSGASPSAGRRFVRSDAGRTVRWRWSEGQDEELLVQSARTGNAWDLVRRALGPGRLLNWVFNDNGGTVDDTVDGEVLRSAQPSPNDLLRLRAQGVRTILSLNGDQDEEATLYTDPEGEAEGRPSVATKVNQRAFIASLGFEHATLRMSASRAPTEAELVAAFRVLLDDARRPVLIHCRGGSDRTGVISALYQIEFLGVSKADAKRTMRRHLWLARKGTEVQGAWIDLYQPGALRRLLEREGVPIPERFRR